MKHNLSFFLKPISFLPALLMMYVIFGFSAQTGEISGSLSYDISYRIVDVGNKLLDKEMNELQIEDYAHKIEHPIRKAAHMTEYFLLAIAVSLPLYVYGMRGIPLMLTAGLFCVVFAAGDEYHQTFVAGREPAVKDVMIDSVGTFFGVAFYKLLCNLFSSRNFPHKADTHKKVIT